VAQCQWQLLVYFAVLAHFKLNFYFYFFVWTWWFWLQVVMLPGYAGCQVCMFFPLSFPGYRRTVYSLLFSFLITDTKGTSQNGKLYTVLTQFAYTGSFTCTFLSFLRVSNQWESDCQISKVIYQNNSLYMLPPFCFISDLTIYVSSRFIGFLPFNRLFSIACIMCNELSSTDLRFLAKQRLIHIHWKLCIEGVPSTS
jgi:hypothetical protein